MIKEGDNLITKASDSPTPQDIPADATNITLLKANVSFSNPVRVDKLGVYFAANTGLNKIIKNAKLYVNDKLVDVVSDSDIGNSTGRVVKFNYYGVLSTSNKFVVKIDTQRNTTTNNINGTEITDVKIGNDADKYFEGIEYAKSGNWDPSEDKIKGEAEAKGFTIKVPQITNVSKVDGYASKDYIIAGATNFKLLGAQAQVNNVGSVTVTDLTVNLSGGSNASNGYISVAKLVVDGKVVDTESVSSSSVTFNGLNINIPKASTKVFNVLVDTTTNLTGSIQAIITRIHYIDQYGNDGSYTTPVTGTVFTVKTGAELNITLNSNSPVEQVLAANPNVETEVARFDIKPVYDSAQIQELVLHNVDDSGNTVKSGDSLIQSVYLYDTNGNKLAEASLSSGQVDFYLSNPLELDRDQTTTLVVKVKTSSINDVSVTNIPVRFKLVYTGYAGAKTRITSISNGNEIALDSSNQPTANKIVFRKTLLTFANDEQTSTTLNNGGDNDIYLWSATADQAGAAKIHQFRIYLNASNSNITWSDFRLYHDGNKFISGSDVVIKPSTVTPAGYVTVIFTGTNYKNGFEISAGSTVKFRLVATVNGATGDNDSVTAQLKDDYTGDYEIFSGVKFDDYSGNAVIWSDEAAKSTVTTDTKDWFGAKGLLSLPLNSETLSR